jgi:hypothetical protein
MLQVWFAWLVVLMVLVVCAFPSLLMAEFP